MATESPVKTVLPTQVQMISTRKGPDGFHHPAVVETNEGLVTCNRCKARGHRLVLERDMVRGVGITECAYRVSK